ncbi:MAG: ASKHA domain-containing protein [Roseburia sp.]
MKLIIKCKGKTDKVIEHQGEKTCYELLVEEQIAIAGACGGKGKCGKCQILFLEGVPQPTETEKKFFASEKIKKGYRLACCCGWAGDAVIEVEEFQEETMKILEASEKASSEKNTVWNREKGQLGIAVDIGTTTIAIELFEKAGGILLDSESCMNHGRTFGTDVLARIAAANEGNGEQLRELLQQDVTQGIQKLLRRNKVASDCVREILVSGNTTMQHILLGYSCEKLGHYPFTPVTLTPPEQSFSDVFGVDWLQASVKFMPGISAFIGGDIVMGVYESGMAEKEEFTILLDLGTNGEMVLGNREKMLAASVAAGPALEAGNIEKGMPGVAGAISHVTIEANKVQYQTIGNRTPIGICGTGVLEIVAELLRTGKIDENGTFLTEEESFTIVNGIRFSQNDIRQVQLAKAAVRAGIEILTEDYGITEDEVKTVYLAGGFGYQLNEETAIAIGMIPAEWRGRIRLLGNSSLKGAIRYGSSVDSQQKVEAIQKKITEQNLANHPKFEELYVKNINFS